MTTTSATAEDRKDIWKQIEDTRFAFLTTLSEGNGLRARPVTTQKVEAEGDTGVVWFFIPQDGEMAKDAQANPRVLLTYTDGDENFYASLSGTARVSSDAAKAREMWSKMNEAWFPDGPGDPNLALLRVKIDHGETWEPSTNKMMQFLSIAVAAVTHTTPKDGVHKTFQ
ncbi:MAG: pyridoxamine 5'-phosphate oxidase family protein [Betaproteobacteria bacterium]